MVFRKYYSKMASSCKWDDDKNILRKKTYDSKGTKFISSAPKSRFTKHVLFVVYLYLQKDTLVLTNTK